MVCMEVIICYYWVGGQIIVVLDGVGFEVFWGQFIVIVGFFGLGKFILLNMFGCLDWFDSGCYLFDDVDVFIFDDEYVSDFCNWCIGFVFQFFYLLLCLSVFENVLLLCCFLCGDVSGLEECVYYLFDCMGLGQWLEY